MNTALANRNSLAKVQFREEILTVEAGMNDMIAAGTAGAIFEATPLKHYYSPIDENYGCCAYAREIFLPKGSVVIGKIHKHSHLNLISKGKVSVMTEFGKKYFEAPCTFLSEVGLKRAVYAEEDTIWTTIHLTKHRGEENLDKMEDEIVAKDYSELGLLASVADLPQLGVTK